MPPAADPLAELRPLHLPPPVSWWPPAPGWWLLAGLALGLFGLAWYWRRRGQVRRAALAELQALAGSARETREQLRQLAALLKRYALHCYPGQEVAALTGDAWLRFLDEHGGNGAFTSGCGQVLGRGLFQPGTAVDLPALVRLVERWLRQNRRKG
ncbi:MAG: DUF4381 domain-containing protein [Thermodesulfobacteriota bacterium]